MGPAAATHSNLATPSFAGVTNRARDLLLIVYLVYVFAGGIERALLGEGGGGAMNQLITLGLLGGAGAIYVSGRRMPLETLKAALPLGLAVTIALASVAWSEHADITLRRALRFALETAGLVLLAHCYGRAAEFWRAIWLAFGAIVLANVLAVAAPAISDTRLGYAGIHGHKNGLGGFAIAALPVFVFGAFSRDVRVGPRWISLGFAAVLLALLAFSQSKTAWVLAPASLVIGAGAFLLARRLGGPVLVLAAAAAVFMLLALIPLGGEEILGQIVGLFTGDPTLTGRTALWDYVRWRVGEDVALGLGYGAFWDVGEAQLEEMRRFGLGFVVGQGHNGYLDLYATLGIAGLCVVALVWLGALRGALRMVRLEPAAPALLGLTIVLIVGLHNASESSWLRAGHQLWAVFILASQAGLAALAPMERAWR